MDVKNRPLFGRSFTFTKINTRPGVSQHPNPPRDHHTPGWVSVRSPRSRRQGLPTVPPTGSQVRATQNRSSQPHRNGADFTPGGRCCTRRADDGTEGNEPPPTRPQPPSNDPTTLGNRASSPRELRPPPEAPALHHGFDRPAGSITTCHSPRAGSGRLSAPRWRTVPAGRVLVPVPPVHRHVPGPVLRPSRRRRHHPLIAPVSIPLAKCFCTNGVSTMIGTSDSDTTHICRPSCEAFCSPPIPVVPMPGIWLPEYVYS